MHKSFSKKLSILLVLSMIAMLLLPIGAAFAAGGVTALTVNGPDGVQNLGVAETFTATATDVGGTPEYQFWFHDASGWKVVQDYSTTNTYSFTPTTAGSYTVAAYALDKADIAAGNWSNALYKSFVINAGSTLTATTAPAAPMVNQAVTITAASTGITAPVYQYWYWDGVAGDNWVQSGDYTTNTTYNFTPAAAGTYKYAVYAKDPIAPNDSTHALCQSGTITVAPATLSVTSVSAINGSQLQVVFNKAVDSTTAQTAGNYSLVGDTLSGNPVLQADGKTVVLNLATVIGSTSTPVAITISGVKSKDLSETAPLYTTTVTVADTTPPSIVSVKSTTGSANATSATVTFSEPIIDSSAVFKVDGVTVANSLDATKTIETLTVNLDPTKSHTLVVLGVTDLAGNVINPNPTTYNFNVTQDVAAPTATVTANNDGSALVTFSAPMTAATVNTTNILVKDELYSSVATATVAPLAGDTTNTKFVVAINDPTMYANKTSRTYTLVFNTGIEDANGNAMVATTKSVTLTQDTSVPAISSVTFDKNASGNVTDIVLNYNKALKAGSITTSAITVVDANGVLQPTTFFTTPVTVNAGDTSVTLPLTTATALTGKYTFNFPASMVEDNTVDGNASAASTQVVDFGSAPSTTETLTAAAANNGTNVIKVTFTPSIAGDKVKGGAVAGSATDVTNYSLNGSALPAGTTIYLDSAQLVATITLPANSIATTDANAVLNISGIQSVNGVTLTPFAGHVAITDNIAPTLTGATENADKTVSLSFSEPVTGLVVGDLSISVNGAAALTPTTDYTVAAGTGGDAGKWVVTYTSAPTAGASVKITINSGATGVDAAGNAVKAGGTATVTAI